MEERSQQYRRKINFIVEKLNSFPTKFSSSETVDAYLYRVQFRVSTVLGTVA
ncbi:MAG: hypothetical protein AABX13_00055 [Nanoarchaeota archaeon]